MDDTIKKKCHRRKICQDTKLEILRGWRVFASCQFVVGLEDTLTMTRKMNAKKSSLFSLAIMHAMISVTPLMFP